MRKSKSTMHKILIVGQGVIDPDNLRHELEKNEFGITEEHAPTTALSKISKNEIPIVIYQQTAPLLEDGFIRKCTRLSSHPCTIVITKNRSIDNMRELFRQGVYDCLIHPFELPHLIQSIKRGLEKRKAVLYGIKDPLTGLYNRYSFTEILRSEIDRAQRYNRHLSLLMIDIDYFKKINDEFGHIIGDHILVKLADILKSSFRKTDIITRFGGEEFAIVLPETEITHATQLAERIRKKIEQYNYSKFIGSTRLTVSIGISNYHTPHSKKDIRLIHSADQALYTAKQRGRNMVCISSTKRLLP